MTDPSADRNIPDSLDNGRTRAFASGRLFLWASSGIALFHVWANTFGNISDLWRNSLHFALLGGLAFLYFPPMRRASESRKLLRLDMLFSLMTLSTGFYLVFFENALHERNEVPLVADLIFAGIAVLLALELGRRTSGYVIPFLAVFMLSYVLWWGELLSGLFSIRHMGLPRVLYRMFFTDEGLFGMIATISSTYVFMFILFAAFLLKSGGAQFIIRLAHSLTHRLAGGPGLVAVFASGMMGTISGSAVANTVSTGSITIPVMKNAGFTPRFAAAVETASSTGGQLMPPIMGAGAFIMAQWTQIPYSTIIAAAFLPAVLYFFSVAFYVYLEAKKGGVSIPGERGDRESAGQVLKDGFQFLIPLSILVTLLILGFTPTFTAGVSILAVILSSWLNPRNRMGFKAIMEALSLGTRNMLITGILLVVTGIIVGSINMTGVSLTFSQLVVQWSGMNLALALLLVTLASLLLGMGLPVTAAYIMIAILTVPALESMGVSLLAAHMIIFWLSQDSNVTPPVCLAAFAASSISGSHPMKTGLTSWNLAKALYILPVLFAYSELIDGTWLQRLGISGFALLGLFSLAVSFTGHMIRPLSWMRRSGFFLCALALFWPGLLIVKGAAILVLGILLLEMKLRSRGS